MEATAEPPAPIPAGPEAVATDFVECYLQHYGRLVRALRLAGADGATAEDVAQEAFARALVRWPRVSRGPNPPGYLYTAAFRLLRRHLARAARWDIGGTPEPGPAGGPADRTAAEASARVDVEAVLARMPPKRRAAAVLCLIVGLTSEEAGAVLGIAPGTVRKHLEQARADLART